MPQLDFTTYIPQLFWLGLTFAILYFVMSRLALPRVGEVLEERQNRIDDDLELAEKHRSESLSLEESYEKLTAAAKADVVAFLKAEREKIHSDISARQSEKMDELHARIEEAEKRVAKAKDEAMADLEGMASDICSSIVTKLTGTKMTDAAAKKAVRAVRGEK